MDGGRREDRPGARSELASDFNRQVVPATTLEEQLYSRNHYLTNPCDLPLNQYSPLSSSKAKQGKANSNSQSTITNLETMVAASVGPCEGGDEVTASVSTSASTTQQNTSSVHSAWPESSGRLYDSRSILVPHFLIFECIRKSNIMDIAYVAEISTK